jgi:hypothetical protein
MNLDATRLTFCPICWATADSYHAPENALLSSVASLPRQSGAPPLWVASRYRSRLDPEAPGARRKAAVEREDACGSGGAYPRAVGIARNHHTLPAFYLKRFADDNGLLSRWDKATNE